MKINKAYKFRLYPTNSQKELINKTFGCTRFIYNYYLDKKSNLYKNEQKNINAYELIKDIPNLYKERPYLKEIDSCSLRCSIFDLDNAYKKFFKEKIGYPKYKSKYNKNSYRTNFITSTYKGKTYENIKLDLKNKIITLPKLKEVKIRGYRNTDKIIGIIKSATITKEADKYYVSVLVEEELIKPAFVPNNIVGIDLGIKDLIITSNNEKIKNSIDIQKYQKKIKGLQKALSRSQKGSKNRYKIKIKLQKVYRKLRNARKYLIINITNKIEKENDIIITENLDVKSMYQTHSIAKHLNNAPLGKIIERLKYKCEINNKQFIQIDRYYPSSQICSKCGYQNKKVKDLSVRKWECPNCHNKLDRDYNAAENILFEGIKIYMKGLVQV